MAYESSIAFINMTALSGYCLPNEAGNRKKKNDQQKLFFWMCVELPPRGGRSWRMDDDESFVTRSYGHPFIHSLTHSCIHSFIHSFWKTMHIIGDAVNMELFQKPLFCHVFFIREKADCLTFLICLRKRVTMIHAVSVRGS